MAEGSDKAEFPLAERRLRLGIVGGGQGSFIGKVHARGARLSNRWDVVAGALSSRAQVAKESGRAWLFADDRIYTDYRVMAEREAARPDGIDAVAITTPNNSHHAIACAFMEKGIDVISDKPLTTTLADALESVTYDMLEALHSGWENGDGASGAFTIDVGKQSIHLLHRDHYIAHDISEYEC